MNEIERLDHGSELGSDDNCLVCDESADRNHCEPRPLIPDEVPFPYDVKLLPYQIAVRNWILNKDPVRICHPVRRQRRKSINYL